MTIKEYAYRYNKLGTPNELDADNIQEGAYYAISISKLLTPNCLIALCKGFNRVVEMAENVTFMDKNLFIAHMQNYLLAQCLTREITDPQAMIERIREEQPPISCNQILERSEQPAILVIHPPSKNSPLGQN